jgi:hypothetical protein
MAIKDELRFRVRRFLTGPFDANDLTKLFLFLRGYSYGRQSVRDLGDMIGHADVRTKGLSVDRVREVQTIALYTIPRFLPNGPKVLVLSDAPSALLAAMDATFNCLDDALLKYHTGMTRAQVGTILTRIKRKFSVKNNGNLYWDSHPINEKELSVIKCLTSFLMSKEIYSADELVEDTLCLLLKHQLIDGDQLQLFHAKRDYLVIFAVASMHGVTFDCPDGVPAEAKAGWSTEGDNTHLSVSVNFPVPGGPELALSLFDTNLHPSLWSEDYEAGSRNVHFNCPIEITNEGKLRCMI